MNVSINIPDDRIVSLEGGQNCREVGGYPAAGGKRLRRGLIWRSARLNELTGADLELDAMSGIHAVVDLRLAEERSAHPTPAAFLDRRNVISWDSGTRADSGTGSLFAKGLDAEGYAHAVRDFYRNLAAEHRRQLSGFYHLVAGGGLPVLVHCSAGKDRTGIAVAILLELVGVERPYVVADYCKTSELLDWAWLTRGAAGAGLSMEWLDRLDPGALDALMGAHPSYILAALEGIEESHGSVENFAADILGVDRQMVARLRDLLLEP